MGCVVGEGPRARTDFRPSLVVNPLVAARGRVKRARTFERGRRERGIASEERRELMCTEQITPFVFLCAVQGGSGGGGGTAYDTENGLLVGWNELNLRCVCLTSSMLSYFIW